MKVCIKCKDTKDINLFSPDKRRKDGTGSSCKSCRKEYTKNWYAKNQKTQIKKGFDYYYKNKRELLETARINYLNNKEFYKKKKIEHYWSNPEKARADSNRWYCDNHDRALETRRKYRADNIESVLVTQRESSKKYHIKMRDTPEYKAKQSCGRMLRRLVKMAGEGRPAGRTEKILKYTYTDFKSHIESMFSDGMSWSNHGEWHIDHVVSIKSLLDVGVTNPAVINSLNNLRPMWAKDNLSKGASFQLVCSSHSLKLWKQNGRD